MAVAQATIGFGAKGYFEFWPVLLQGSPCSPTSCASPICYRSIAPAPWLANNLIDFHQTNAIESYDLDQIQ
jgi:hypothetical protein